jgi:hypothetical protein
MESEVVKKEVMTQWMKIGVWRTGGGRNEVVEKVV